MADLLCLYIICYIYIHFNTSFVNWLMERWFPLWMLAFTIKFRKKANAGKKAKTWLLFNDTILAIQQKTIDWTDIDLSLCKSLFRISKNWGLNSKLPFIDDDSKNNKYDLEVALVPPAHMSAVGFTVLPSKSIFQKHLVSNFSLIQKHKSYETTRKNRIYVFHMVSFVTQQMFQWNGHILLIWRACYNVVTWVYWMLNAHTHTLNFHRFVCWTWRLFYFVFCVVAVFHICLLAGERMHAAAVSKKQKPIDIFISM